MKKNSKDQIETLPHEPQIPEEYDAPIQDHPTASQEFIDDASSLATRLTTMYIFGMSRWENEGIVASHHQLDQDLTNVEEHLASLKDRYSPFLYNLIIFFDTLTLDSCMLLLFLRFFPLLFCYHVYISGFLICIALGLDIVPPFFLVQ